jgi:hypothetical protein
MSNLRRHRILIFSLIFLMMSVTQAAQSQEIYQFYTGVRQLGMGGAYTAVVDDETALLTNPAGLGKIRDSTLTIVDPELDLGAYDSDAVTSSNMTKVLNIQDLDNALSSQKGKHWHLKGQIFPSLVLPNMGIGVHAKTVYDAEVDQTGTNFRLDYTQDYAAALGYCLRFFGGIIKIGVSGRLVDRTEAHKDLDATATNLDLKTIQSEGLGLASDVGIIISAPIEYLPSLSAVVHDAGNTSYTLSSGMFNSTATRPADSIQTIDVGIAFFPILANHDRFTITAEYHDVATAGTETDALRRVHAGAEFNIHDFLFLRGGMNQRYYTAGIELASERFQLQAATYGEEIGVRPANREDRRYVGKFSIRF